MSKDGHVKRPMNCFMVYCKHERANVQEMHPDMGEPKIRSILGMQWNALSPGKQKKYRDESKTLKKMHSAEFPFYKFNPRPFLARNVKCSLKRATEKTATFTKLIYQNQRTGDSSSFSDSTASGNQNVMNGVQKMSRLRRCLRKEPLQHHPLQLELLQQKPLQQKTLEWRPSQWESLQQEPLQRDSLEWAQLQPEPLQQKPLPFETIQRAPVWEPGQRHQLGPNWGLVSLPPSAADQQTCDTDIADALAVGFVNWPADSDEVLELLMDLDKTLDALASESFSQASQQTQQSEISCTDLM